MPNPNVVTANTSATISVPVGTVVSFAGTVAPNGWLLCDGSGITQATYPNLYGLIGANVPDLRSRFIVGAGQGGGLSNRPLKSAGGEETHYLSENEMPNHSHAYGVGGGNGGGNNGGGNSEGWSTTNWSFTTWTARTGGNVPHNNMPPFYALTYIIKY
ncbi:tail fiber protein [Undibacterium sp. TS12]|uniref:phage tail protein n=1 Tax=Undibacterium sp. TS12 TaxID=2908202 RepID=UPI001F4CE80C|nr:tail fiber protein [Undibacterium sp. TS12]MCH8620972.1 tail fiber protein [Undibacterium sp. TS12]